MIFFIIRAISSVGSEHLVYTQGVGSSSLSSPTKKREVNRFSFFILKREIPSFILFGSLLFFLFNYFLFKCVLFIFFFPNLLIDFILVPLVMSCKVGLVNIIPNTRDLPVKQRIGNWCISKVFLQSTMHGKEKNLSKIKSQESFYCIW